jgi:PAS domain S-box-containing protein
MAEDKYSYEELSAICDQLQVQVSRGLKVEQDLISTRDALDQELARFKVLQAFNDAALKVKDVDALTVLSLESVVEAFEFEVAALLRFGDDPDSVSVLGNFGMYEVPADLPFDRNWLEGDDSRLYEAEDPLLQAWSCLDLQQAILCPFFDNAGSPYGLVVGGRKKGSYYEPIKADIGSPFRVMVQQVGALWVNYHLNVLMQESKYSVLFHQSNDAILLLDMEANVVDTNQRGVEMFGCPKQELTGRNLFDLIACDEREMAQSQFARLGDEGSVRFEACCLRSDQEMFPGEVSGSQFEMDGRKMVHGLVRDMTQLHRSQQQLILSERMAALGQLIAGVAHEINTPVGVIRASIGNISSALSQTLERLPEVVRTLPAAELDKFFALLARARQEKSSFTSREERHAKRDLLEILDESSVIDAERVAETLVDMGIHDGVEDLLCLFKGEYAGTLESAYNLSSLQRNSENIQTAVERASKVVFALRKFAHHDHSGQMVAADLADGMETVLTLYQNQLKQGVEVIRDYDSLPEVPCFPDELNQVWTNLVHNALQAMGFKGRIECSVKQENDCAVVRVVDDGPGIPKEIQARIFEPFFTTKPAGEGSGLGLDICNKIVERHQGRMDMDSQPGRTEFRVTIPLIQTQTQTQTPSES